MVNHQPRLLGLIGPRQSGKSHLGEILREHHGYAVTAVADPIRMMLVDTDPEWAAQLRAHGYVTAKRDIPEFRQKIINLGDSARRWIGPDVWVHAVDRRVATWHRFDIPVVITDIRRWNEVRWLEQNGGILVHVERAGHTHESDTVASIATRAPYTIFNPGDPEGYAAEACCLLSAIGAHG